MEIATSAETIGIQVYIKLPSDGINLVSEKKTMKRAVRRVISGDIEGWQATSSRKLLE